MTTITVIDHGMSLSVLDIVFTVSYFLEQTISTKLCDLLHMFC